jgi:hypothetical protein
METDFQTLVPSESIEETETSKPLYENYSNEVSDWLWNGEPLTSVPDNTVSFVYRITNKVNGKFYIGYKGFLAKKTKVVKGKKKHLLVESNWKKYWSSGDNLHKDIAYYGVGNFKREILAFCTGKGIGKYVELYLQLYLGVLTHNKDKTYNGIVNVRLSSKTVAKFDEVVFCDEFSNKIKL